MGRPEAKPQLPQVSDTTRVQFSQELAEKMQRRVQKLEKKQEWGNRLEAAARTAEPQQEEAAVAETSVKRKHKDASKDKKRNKQAKKHEKDTSSQTSSENETAHKHKRKQAESGTDSETSGHRKKHKKHKHKHKSKHPKSP